MLRVRMCGGLELEADGRLLPDALVGGRQGRLALAFLVCERARAVRREELADLLWPDRLPDSWSASLSAVISRLRRLLQEAGIDGADAISSSAGAYRLVLPPDTTVDLDELVAAVGVAEAAAVIGDVDGALEAARVAEAIAVRGFLADDGEWVDRQRALVADLRARAALARSAAHRRAGAHGRAVEAARDALALDDAREAAYRELMLALAAAGERAEALRVWERCRTTLVEELGVDPSPETEAVYREVLGVSAAAEAATTALPSGVVTFLLTDIVGSSALWDDAPAAMAVALERHDVLVAEVVAAQGGTLLKSKLEGDATVSVFARASDAVAAALGVRGAVDAEPWPDGAELRLRMAVHTGEAFERGGDYFGPALNRAARLRALGGEHEVLLSQAVTELVRDHLPAGAVLRDLGHRELRGMARGENVYALSRSADGVDPDAGTGRSAFVAPPLPAPLGGSGPFVGRADELQQLVDRWDVAVGASPGAVFVGGEPGVGKSRLAAELAAHAHAAGAVVLHGRCDEDLAAALHPFVEALRPLVPALGGDRLASVRGVDELARVLPQLEEVLPARGPAVRADPDTERLALFDAFASVLRTASVASPVLLVLDDLHWAGKTTLSLLRHVLRETGGARLLVVGTYRDTELARTHPLAETLADLRRDGTSSRISLGGLASDDVGAYLAAVGIDDRALGLELAEVTSGNPYFLIEVVRHVEEAGGTWSTGDLPEGVREATGRRLSRLGDSTNRALTVAAVAGTTFDLTLVEQVDGHDLLDEIAEACHAGLVVEEPGAAGRFRFAHAIVRQVLLAELVTVKRARLHRQIAELLDAAPVVGDPDARLADLAYHWCECASLGDAGKAVGACRRAAEQAVARLAYEEAGDLYAMAIQVLDATGDVDAEARAELHLARCAALLAGGDVARAREAIDALEGAVPGSERLAAWYSTYAGLLAVLAEPDRLPEIVRSIGAAADAMRALGDLRGEAQAHYVHATALERLGQIGAAERALDAALAAARAAGDRGLADSILAEAPLAALWGPSSITRASGRCLDVVRVLRINGGAPAVESVAIRCQAVLEALRGRADAARRMVASARRTTERLGLTHRGLETEVAAGLIELLDGDATAAEAILRPAYRGLRERGLDGEAAQAAAFLARALLLQDRVDDADAVAAEAAALAGADLKAGIAWRGVRAECAGRRGDGDLALRLAGEAVDLAAATDALLLVADARLALAAVLRTLGDDGRADEEARRALEACTAKGATALAARLGAAPWQSASTVADGGPSHAALISAIRLHEAFDSGDLDELRAVALPQLAEDGEARFTSPRLLVAHGDRAALLRWVRLAPEGERPVLTVVEVDDAGRFIHWIVFEVGDRRAANLELERVSPASAEHDTKAWRAATRMAVATNERDWDAYIAALAPAHEQRDRRPAMPVEDSYLDEHQVLFGLDDVAYERAVVALHGDRRVLCRDVIWFRDGAVEDAEITTLQLVEVDDAGLVTSQTSFGIDELETALAALHAGGEEVRSTSAWRALQRLADAINAHDWDALMATIGPGYQVYDRRGSVTAPDGTDPVAVYRILFSLDDWSMDLTPIDRHGDRRVLARYLTRFRDGAVAESEVESLVLVEVDDGGRLASNTTFAPDDLDAALAALHADDPAASTTPLQENDAWRASVAFRRAFETSDDWAGVAATLADGFELDDRRSGVRVRATGDAALDLYRTAFGLDEYRWQGVLVTTRGERLAVIRDHVSFADQHAGRAEVASVSIVESAPDGRVRSMTAFDEDDLAGALAELDRRYDEQVTTDELTPTEGNAAWTNSLAQVAAADRRDWDEFAATLHPAYEYVERRRVMWLPSGAPVDSYYRTMFALDDWHFERTLLAIRDERLALVRQSCRFQDGATGPAESTAVAILEVAEDGRLISETAFDADDLDAARAELDRHAAAPRPNRAWAAVAAAYEAFDRRDWDGWVAHHLPEQVQEHRQRGTGHVLVGPDAFRSTRVLWEMDEAAIERRLVATEGDRVALVRIDVRGSDGAVGAIEYFAVNVIEIAEDGRIARQASFDAEDAAVAMEHLHERARALSPPPNSASALVAEQEASFARRDWEAFRAGLGSGFVVDDRGRTAAVQFDEEQSLATLRYAFDLPALRWHRPLVATRGDRLALARDELVSTLDTNEVDYEKSSLTLVELDADGRACRHTVFEPDDLLAALTELDERAAQLSTLPLDVPREAPAREELSDPDAGS